MIAKKKYYLIFYIFILYHHHQFVEAQSPIQAQLSFKQITINEGLSHNKVNCIHQDHQGFIWFATNEGLNRFDGYTIKIYRNDPKDETTIKDNFIHVIYEDSYNNLWIGNSKGLNRYNRDKDTFVEHKYNNSKTSFSNIFAINQDKKKMLWIGSNDTLFCLNPKTYQITGYWHFMESPVGVIISIYEDTYYNLWIGTSHDGLYLFNKETGQFKHFINIPDNNKSISGNRIESIYQDQTGNLWLGTFDNGVNLFNYNDSTFTRMSIDKKDKSSDRVRSITQDNKDNLWFGTRNGLYLKDPEENIFTHYAHMNHDFSRLNHNSIYQVYIDDNDIMWIATYAGGANFADLNQKKFIHYTKKLNNYNFLNNDIIQAFAEEKNGNIWIATGGKGINYLNRTTGKFSYFTHNSKNINTLSSDNVKALAVDRLNNLWIGTYHGGLDYYNTKTKVFTHYKHNPNNTNSIRNADIYALLIDSDQNLWIATDKGVEIFDTRKKKFYHLPGKMAWIRAFYEEDTRIWIGTYYHGLYYYDKIEKKIYNFKNDIINGIIETIYRDSKDNLWIGGNKGLFYIKSGSDSIIHIIGNKKQAIELNTVYGILEDKEHNLWLSTSSSGLIKFINAINKSEEANFRKYDTNDGIQSKQFNNNAYMKSKTGQMFFGGINGFNVFYPEKIKDNPYKPKVVLTNFKIFNEPVPIEKEFRNRVILNKSITQSDQLTLSYKDYVFTFEFSALHYVNSTKNIYAYIMEDFEEEWNYVNTQHMATYTNIDPGNYIFKVKASNNDGIWNEQGIAINIIITPPFWSTWWFRILIAILIFLIIIASIHIRTNRIRKQNLELEKHVSQRTQELETLNKELEAFTYSVSHDLRTPLRGMSGLCSILLEDYSNKLDEVVKSYLNRISMSAKNMGLIIDNLLKLSRLIRSEVNFETVNLSDIAKKIIQELKQTDHKRKIDITIADNLIIKGDPILLQVVLRNLLDNAWKFTSKKLKAKIEFGKTTYRDKTVFFVKDNGIGIEMEYVDNLFEPFQRQQNEFEGTGIGLATTKRIIHKHGGKIWAEGNINKGTIFYFTVKSN